MRLAVFALPFALLCSLPQSALGKDDNSSKQKPKSKSSEHVESHGPPTLSLESLDLEHAHAVVRVGGVAKAPDARLFTFHDDRSRHFIAMFASCEPAPPRVLPATTEAAIIEEQADKKKAEPHKNDELLCELEIPRPYLRANVRGLTVHVHEKEVAADEADVIAKWSSARKTLPKSALSPFTVPGAGEPGFRAQRFDGMRGAVDAVPVDDPGVEATGAPGAKDGGVKKTAKKPPTQEGADEVGGEGETETDGD